MLSNSEPLRFRQTGAEDTDRHKCTASAATEGSLRTEENSTMGLKIQNSSLPPMKVLISKKLHILRPAIEYVQQISKAKKVRRGRSVFIYLWRMDRLGLDIEKASWDFKCLLLVNVRQRLI